MFAENMAMCFAKCAPHRHGVRRRNNCTDKHPPERATEPATEKGEAHKIRTQPASDVEDPAQGRRASYGESGAYKFVHSQPLT